SIVSLVFSFFIREPETSVFSEKNQETKERSGFRLDRFLEVNAIPLSFVTLAIGFAYSSILSFVTAFANEARLTEAAAYFFLVYSVTVLLSRPFTGRLMDRKGANYVVYPSILFFALGIYIVSTAHSSFL